MSHYQVKFQFEGETKYGIVKHDWNNEAPEGALLIEDAVTPDRYIVADDENVVDIPHDVDDILNGGNEVDKFVKAAFDKAYEASKELPDGLVVGKLFSIGVGDGQAWYLVTKVNKKTCHIEWRGFCPDRWTDRHFGQGGKFDVEEVARCTGWNDALKKMFSR